MIEKIHKCRSISDKLRYILRPTHRPRVVAGTVAGGNIDSIALEMNLLRRLRPSLQYCCVHIILSLAPGERVSEDILRRIASEYMLGMGYRTGAWMAAEHRDTAIQHVHIFACRVLPDRSVVSTAFDFIRGEEIIRKLEVRHRLRCQPRSSECLRHAPGRVEVRKGRSDRLVLQRLVSEASKGQPSLTDFVERLSYAGVRVAFHTDANEKPNGISFALEGSGYWFAGRSLGRGYRFNHLLTRGRSYVEARELAAGGRGYEQARQGEDRRLSRTSELNPASRTNVAQALNRPHDGDPSKSPITQRKPNVLTEHGGVEKNNGEDALRVVASRLLLGNVSRGPDHRSIPIALGRFQRESRLGEITKQLAALEADSYWLKGILERGGKESSRSQRWEAERAESNVALKRLVAGDGPFSREEIELLAHRPLVAHGQWSEMRLLAVDGSHRYLNIAGLTSNRLRELKSCGYQPALVQSVGDRFDIVLKAPALGDTHEPEAACLLAERLREKFENSPGVEGIRLAGPIGKLAVKVLEARDVNCPKVAQELEAIRAQLQMRYQRTGVTNENQRKLTFSPGLGR